MTEIKRATCIKCGKGPIHTLYKDQPARYGQNMMKGEHLRRFCGHCWYEWGDLCMDHQNRSGKRNVVIKEERGISPDESLMKNEKEPTYKNCMVCGELKLLTQFEKNGYFNDGYNDRCNQCPKRMKST